VIFRTPFTHVWLISRTHSHLQYYTYGDTDAEYKEIQVHIYFCLLHKMLCILAFVNDFVVSHRNTNGVSFYKIITNCNCFRWTPWGRILIQSCKNYRSSLTRCYKPYHKRYRTTQVPLPLLLLHSGLPWNDTRSYVLCPHRKKLITNFLTFCTYTLNLRITLCFLCGIFKYILFLFLNPTWF
jgi:hypothetical protein